MKAQMTTRFFIWLLPAALIVTGCARKKEFQVVVNQKESIQVGDPVHIDNIRAGRVTVVGVEGGERVANLSIEMAAGGDKMREGLFRVPAEGRIELIGREVKENAKPLPKGARIPTRSKIAEVFTRYATSSTLIACGIAAAIFVLIFVIFRSLISAVGLIICSFLAGMVTQALYLYVVPLIAWLYERYPPPAPTGEEGSEAVGPGPQLVNVVNPPEEDGGVIGQAIENVSELLVSRPDPRVLAWCVTFVVLFIFFNILLGRVARIWRK